MRAARETLVSPVLGPKTGGSLWSGTEEGKWIAFSERHGAIHVVETSFRARHLPPVRQL